MNKTLLTVLVILLSACGSGGVDDVDITIGDDLTLETSASSNNSSDGVSLDSFNINPNTINPAINGGQFELSWEASNFASSYFVDMVFSLDRGISDDDIIVFSEFCTLEDCAQTEVSTTCFFTNSNTMSCSAFGGSNLSPLIETLPLEAYLILQLCDDAERSSCSTKIEGVFLL